MSTSPKLVIWGYHGCLLDDADQFFDDAPEAVKALAERGYRQVIVTSFEDWDCIERVQKAGIAPYLGAIGTQNRVFSCRSLLTKFEVAPADVVGVVATIEDVLALRECDITNIVVVPRGVDSPEVVRATLDDVAGLIIVETLRAALELSVLQ